MPSALIKFTVRSAVVAVMMVGGALVLCAADDGNRFPPVDADGVIRVGTNSTPSPEVPKIWATNNVSPMPISEAENAFLDVDLTTKIVVITMFVLFAAWLVVFGILATGKSVHVPGEHSRRRSRGLPGESESGSLQQRGPPL